MIVILSEAKDLAVPPEPDPSLRSGWQLALTAILALSAVLQTFSPIWANEWFTASSGVSYQPVLSC